MPHTHRRRAASLRARITGETTGEAASGLARDGGHGLDRCTDGQLQLRTLLALGLFNAGPIAAPPGWWYIHAVTNYTVVISPRYRRLQLVTSTPRNVTQHLLPNIHGDNGLPGLRLAARQDGAFLLHHLPTGTDVLITDRRGDNAGPVSRDPATPFRNFACLSTPLTDHEETTIAALPPVSHDARILLAALVSRLNVTDPDGGWATGIWWWDPLQRPDRDNYQAGVTCRRLWGAHDRWDLRWSQYPHPRRPGRRIGRYPHRADRHPDHPGQRAPRIHRCPR